MYFTKNWLLVVIGMILVLTALGCPPAQDSGDDTDTGNGVVQDDGTADTPGQVEPEPPIEGTEEGTMDGDETDREGEGEADTNGEGVTSDEDFEATDEQPLAPPAEPAAGTDSVPGGSVGMAVSLTDMTRGTLPLAESLSVTVLDEIHVQITVVNNTEESTEFVFATAQKLDIIFNDEAGNTVYQWSAGKRFPQVLNALTLEGGDSWSHELTVPVGTGAGQLPPGTYNVIVTLTGTPPVSFMASGVEIKKS